jgi:hypothetical protein
VPVTVANDEVHLQPLVAPEVVQSVRLPAPRFAPTT